MLTLRCSIAPEVPGPVLSPPDSKPVRRFKAASPQGWRPYFLEVIAMAGFDLWVGTAVASMIASVFWSCWTLARQRGIRR